MKTKIYKLSMVLGLLFLSTNVLWGHSGTHYFQGTATAKNEDGGSGKVYIAYDADDINEVGDVPEWGDTYTTGNTQCAGDDNYHKAYTLCAKPNTGSYFWGWYDNIACTPESELDEYNGTENSPIYKGKTASENSTNSAAPTIETFYAKFSTKRPYRYYAKLNILTSDEQGLVTYTNEIVNGYGVSDIYYYSAGAIGYEKYTGILPLTESSTGTTSRIHVAAKAVRGYVFDYWAITPSTNTTVASSAQYDYSTTKAITAFDVFTTSQDVDNPQMGEVTAHFRTAPTTSVTVTKLATRGSITAKVVYAEFYDSYGDKKIQIAESDLDNMDASASTKTYSGLYEGDSLKLTATPEEGYKFYGWYELNESGEKTLVTTQSTLAVDALDADTYFAHFDNLESANFRVGFTGCNTFEEALSAAVNESSKTIYIQKNYTIPAGNYTIPEGVTLLIPYSENHISTKLVVDRQVNKSNAVPTDPYCTLTLAGGTVLNVYGAIEVGGEQYVGGNVATDGYYKGTGRPGAYGQLVMGDNSSIILNNGARLRAWGYITGTGSIDARRGSEVREQFQIMDWKGGSAVAYDLQNNPQQVFPVNQYFIQNIEVATQYRPGSRLFTSMSVCNDSGSTTAGADNVQIIGVGNRNDGEDDDVAMFLMDDNDDSEDSWVRKSYDVENDKQIYDINNSAHLNGITISLPAFGVTLTSSNYNLPITNNMKIHLLNGYMDITQNTVMLPGAEIEIDKKSMVTINEGQSLYLYDTDQWDKYAYDGAYAKQVPFRPGGVSSRDVSTPAALGDAAINVHGTLDVKGTLYTTDGGANIYSSIADAGTVQFSTNAGAGTYVYQWKNSGDKYFAAACTSAQLKNENSTFTPTVGTTATEDAPVSFCFIDFDEDGNGEWKSLETDGCFVKDEDDVYYIKPQEYVAISQGAAPEEEADHTYRDHYAGTDRIFILAAEGNCQFWEVRVVPGHPDLFECINENNHTFYYYDEEADNWLEKKFKVSWVNWDGSPVNYTNSEDEEVNFYMVTYGTVPTWMSNNPTHTDDASHTYSFSGWLPTPAAVTEDVTYVAQYEERDRMYAITFNDEGDELIQLVYCKLGEIPACTKYDAAANNKVWKTAGGDAIGAVAGDVTYKLFAKETKANYTIRFVNWNGTPIGDPQSVPAGEMPSAPADPEKASDDLHSYSFKAWNPAVVAADADATYTATYEVGPRGYTVTWKNGEATLDTDENVLYGATPSYTGATPTKDADANYSYSFKGWEPAISAVTGNATYTATFYKNINVVADKTISANEDLQTIVVDNEHTLTIAANKTVNTDYLILNGTASNSGQLDLKSNAEINAANAYFDLNLNTDARHWHAFGVPWVVNLDVTPLTEVESGRTYVLGRDYDIIWYDGAERAANGPGTHCWKYVEHTTHILQPGQGYMIAFTSHVNTIRFAKATGTPVLYTGSVTVQAAGEGTNKGINAVANPMAYHANMTIAGVGQVHNGGLIGEDGYSEVTISGLNYIVGKTVYVQVEDEQTITPTSGISPAAAPARRATKATDKKYMVLEDYYTVSLINENGVGNNVYVLPEEDKENKYVIGHDLVKMGMSTKQPQIYVRRYDVNLGLNTTATVNDVAEFPISLYAPAAGEYTVSLNAQPNDDYIVYLTQDGEAIWNLSDSPYVVNLNAGVNKTYGLRLSANKAPMTPTAIDEAIVDAQGDTRKVLINNQVYIIRGDKVYSIDGQLVK